MGRKSRRPEDIQLLHSFFEEGFLHSLREKYFRDELRLCISNQTLDPAQGFSTYPVITSNIASFALEKVSSISG